MLAAISCRMFLPGHEVMMWKAVLKESRDYSNAAATAVFGGSVGFDARP